MLDLSGHRGPQIDSGTVSNTFVVGIYLFVGGLNIHIKLFTPPDLRVVNSGLVPGTELCR